MEEDDIFESDELYMDEEESSFVEDKEDADSSRDEKVGTVVGLVEGKFYKAEKARYTDELRWIRAYQTIVVCTDQMYSLHLQKSLECL